MSAAKRDNRLDATERELFLIDRLIGLEAENAQLKIESEIRDIRIMQNSRAWKLGMFFLRPVKIMRDAARKLIK